MKTGKGSMRQLMEQSSASVTTSKRGNLMKTRHWDRLGNGGLTFTQLGCGTAPLGNLYYAISDDEAHATLEAAWDAGMRYFDTAPQYGLGNSERRLGRFLRSKDRASYVLSTKVGRLLALSTPEERLGIGKWHDVPSRREVYDYSYDGVMRSVEFSLERTGLDRFDILYAHDLDVFTHGSEAKRDHYIDMLFNDGGYRAMLAMRDQGVVKAFGAGVNEWQAARMLAARGDMDLFLLAGRYTLLEQEPLESFLPMCVERGIGIALGGVFNSGILATGPVEGAWYNYNPAPPEILERTRRLENVCKRYGVRLIDAALRFPLAHPAIVSILVGAKLPHEARSAPELLTATIPPALWDDLKAEGLIHASAPVATS
jgi:D-threo-aldose 1-dehydrogenase